jgi:hypothetical protein
MTLWTCSMAPRGHQCRPRTVFTIAAVILVPVHLITAFAQRNNSIGAPINNLTNTLNTGQSAGTSDSQVSASTPPQRSPPWRSSSWAGDRSVGVGLVCRRRRHRVQALRASFRRTPALVARSHAAAPEGARLCGFYVGPWCR